MVKTTLDIDSDLWRRFSLLVLRERGERKKKEIISEMIKDYVERQGLLGDRRQITYILQIEEEREAFLEMQQKLIHDPLYRGQYVAIHKGQIVGTDEDKGRLAETVYHKYGYVPIYIDRVASRERLVEVPSPELTNHEI